MIEKAKLRILIALFAVLITGVYACGGKDVPVVDPEVAAVKVAVNSSFKPTAKLLAVDFTTNTGIAVILTEGSDQELVDMIADGGDYDVFMASDVKHPEVLIEQGKAKGDSALVYAYGIAALYSKIWKVHWTAAEFLFSGEFNTLGVPNPKDNRYGQAGIAILKNIGVYDSVESKIVYTANEQETLDRILTKELDSGFVMYSSLSDRSKRWAWIVPQKVYDPIEQVAVLITRDDLNNSAKIWMGYLNTEGARSIIQQSGYGIVPDTAVTSAE